MSAQKELQHVLSQIPPPSSSSSPQQIPPNNPMAIAHAALQHLRDSGDPNFLFLRTLVEITSDANNNNNHNNTSAIVMDPNQQELLFHCVTGFRHVLLHKWNTIVDTKNHTNIGQEFCGCCRDYLLQLGISRSYSISKAVAMACLNASASFWKRSWDTIGSSNAHLSNSSDIAVGVQDDATLRSLINIMHTSSPTLLHHRLSDQQMLLSHLQNVITYPIMQQQQQQQQQQQFNHNNNHNYIQKSIMASSFLSTLIAEFAGTSRATMSYYNLSLEYHRKLSKCFQDQFGLDQILELGMASLGNAVQQIHHQQKQSNTTLTNNDTIPLMDLVANIISLIGDTLSWDFHGGGWNDAQALSASILTSSTLIRLPVKWREFVINPDFIRALFLLYSSFQQVSSSTSTNSNLVNNIATSKHTIRQLILILSSLTGNIFSTPETRKGYAEYLVEGTLTILSSILPSIQSNSQENGMEVVDMCCILSRIVSNFKLNLLSQLGTTLTSTTTSKVTFENLVLAMSSVGCQILKRQLLECQRVKGDLELILDDGWEWREEAWNHILEGSVMLAEDSFTYTGEGIHGKQQAKALKLALGTKLSMHLYSTYVTTRIEMSRLEEHFLTQNADDVDEVREQISELNLEEQMGAAACLGRLHLQAALQCLSNVWGQISSRLHTLFESSTTTTSEVTPDASALLEEACLLITCLCHLLTDDNVGETPLIPVAIIEACTESDETTTMIVNMIRSVISLAEYHASRVAQHPNNPNLSPFLGKTLLFLFSRWVSSYVIPPLSEYSDYGNAESKILIVWSSTTGHDSATLTVISFCVTLCLHYYCYWPQETAVHRNATKLLLALAQRGVECRRLVICTMSFEQLVALHAVTAGAWHGSSDAELDAAIANYKNICQNLSRELVKGYQRIPYESRGNALQGLLSCCCDDDQKAVLLYDICLRSVQTSFSNLMQALSEKRVHPQDIHAQDMASLCVFLHIGVCQNYHPDRIPTFLTPVLPHLSGLMKYYAEDLSICESLLHLFRDYAEQYISVLDQECCLALFQASSDLLRSYSTCHCASRVIHRGNLGSVQADVEEDQSYGDVLSAIQLLIHLGTKDFIDICNTETSLGSKSIDSDQITGFIFFGLQQILPLMTQGLLHYPTLCSHYFSLVGFMMDTYPDKACALPYDLFSSLLDSLLFGMSHTDASISKSSLRGIAEIAREHLKNRVLQNHLNYHPDILIHCCRRLLQEVIFQSIIWDRLEAAGAALLPLVAVNMQQFVELVNKISGELASDGKKKRLESAFERLLKPEVLTKVVSVGYERRKSRIEFKKDFEFFVRDVHSFLVIH